MVSSSRKEDKLADITETKDGDRRGEMLVKDERENENFGNNSVLNRAVTKLYSKYSPDKVMVRPEHKVTV